MILTALSSAHLSVQICSGVSRITNQPHLLSLIDHILQLFKIMPSNNSILSIQRMGLNLQLMCELPFCVYHNPCDSLVGGHSSETLLHQQDNRTIESVMMGSMLQQWFTHLIEQGLLTLPGLPALSTIRPGKSRSSAASGKPTVPFELFVMMNMVGLQISSCDLTSGRSNNALVRGSPWRRCRKLVSNKSDCFSQSRKVAR
jgi:hypothetical protein